MTGKSPKTGVRAYARTPVFGTSFDFREVPLMIFQVNGLQCGISLLCWETD